jgi:hypothetical protein
MHEYLRYWSGLLYSGVGFLIAYFLRKPTEDALLYVSVGFMSAGLLSRIALFLFKRSEKEKAATDSN